MDKNFPIAFVALSMLAIAGCTIGEVEQAVEPTPITPPTPTESFTNPVVPSKEPETSASATPNLIQLTNAREREQIVSKGRNDPFAELFQPPVRTIPTATSPTEVPGIPTLPTARPPLIPPISRQPTPSTAPATRTTPTATASTPGTNVPKPDTRPPSVLPNLMPGVVANPTIGSVLPPPPQPELAEGVMVSGVVLIGEKLQAIIKVPNEATSRYVQAGQRLGSGLLIKRIEMNEGSNPIVILEQYGIEVARMVGEEPVNSASSATSVEAS